MNGIRLPQTNGFCKLSEVEKLKLKIYVPKKLTETKNPGNLGHKTNLYIYQQRNS